MNRYQVLYLIIGGILVGFGLGCELIYHIPKTIEKEYIEVSTYPTVFDIYKAGNYTCVNITSLDITVFKSLSSSEAIQWAIDHVFNYSTIDIIEDISMDGPIDLCPPSPTMSYKLHAKDGHLLFGQERDMEIRVGPFRIR